MAENFRWAIDAFQPRLRLHRPLVRRMNRCGQLRRLCHVIWPDMTFGSGSEPGGVSAVSTSRILCRAAQPACACGLDRSGGKDRTQAPGLSVSGYVRALIEKDLGMQPSGGLNDLPDPADLNTGDAWSDPEIADIEWGVKHGDSVEELAELLCRMKREIVVKAAELGHEGLSLHRARRRNR